MNRLLAMLALTLAPVAAYAAISMVTIAPNGVEGLTIGMSKSEVERLYRETKFNEAAKGSQCEEASLQSKGMYLLFEKETLARVYLSNPRYVTDKGIHVGSTEKEAKAAYGKALKSTPHKYIDGARYLTLIDAKGNGYRFETDGAQIINISVGKKAALELVEGCL